MAWNGLNRENKSSWQRCLIISWYSNIKIWYRDIKTFEKRERKIKKRESQTTTTIINSFLLLLFYIEKLTFCWGTYLENLSLYHYISLREKCPYSDFRKVSVFLVGIFPHLDWIRRDTEYLSVFSRMRKNTEQRTPNTDTFHTVLVLQFFLLCWLSETQ